MKKVTLLCLMVIGCIISFSSFAEGKSANVTARQPVNVAKEQQGKDIFYFKKEIGLTDEQENKLKALVYDIQKIMVANKAKLDVLTADLSRMIKNKEDMGAIRKKLDDVSKIQVDSTCVDIENGRKIEGVLSQDQLKKWNSIQERERNTK